MLEKNGPCDGTRDTVRGMSTLAEIEAAVKKLPRREQRKLQAFLARSLETPAKAKPKTDPLAAMEAHWARMREITGGKPVLTRKTWRLLAKAIRGE